MQTVQKVQQARQNGHIKSKSQIKKNKDTLYKSSFQNLEDKTIYWDPLGFRNNMGKSVDLKSEFWDE